jgi:hypothetical protein
MVPLQVSKLVLERSGLPSLPVGNPFTIVSFMHRRSLAVQEIGGTWLAFKGVGWVHGPPWVALSKKDDELCFGLLDSRSGQREVAVSKQLISLGVRAAESILCVTLNEQELGLLGVQSSLKFANGRAIEPAVLITRSISAFRVSDFSPNNLEVWRNVLASHFPYSSAEEIVEAFAANLAATICTYQALGADNISLSPDNVTLAAEITDFEWFYLPGIPLPDGTTDAILEKRQLKEAFYFIDVLISLCEGLGISLSIDVLARFGMSSCKEIGAPQCGFAQQLQELANRTFMLNNCVALEAEPRYGKQTD